jgi:hypothetical protein
MNDVKDAPSPARVTLDTKESRTALTKCLNALEDLTDEHRSRVLAAAVVLHGGTVQWGER